MKLFIQIPCFNEENTLPKVIAGLPDTIPGVDEIKVLVIDDGSTDSTVEIAKSCGVDFIVSNRTNSGLAKTFALGIEYCSKLGADIIVNTDGDNQYYGADITKIVAPVVTGHADLVIGARDIEKIPHFSFLKKKLQRLGSFVVSSLADTHIDDATSGFRAMSSNVALAIFIGRKFSYTLETAIQISRRHFSILSVPIAVNPVERPSRLAKSTFHYVFQSFFDLLNLFPAYAPIKFFGFIGALSLSAGIAIGLRFLYLMQQVDGVFNGVSGHTQSLILCSVLLIFGSFSIICGFLADQIARNRQMLEILLEKQRIIEYTAKDLRYLVYQKRAF